MKNNLSLLFVFLTSTISFSQDKKELFYDNDQNEISLEKFTGLKNNKNYGLSYEYETSIKTYLIEGEVSGTLNYYLLESIKKYLIRINPKTNFEKSNFIVINYIDNDPTIYTKYYQVPWDVFENDVSKKLKKIDKINHFYIINPDVKDLYYYHGNKLKWEIDKDHFLQNKFFSFKGLNGGFLIIDKEGNYFALKGEYTEKKVLDKVKELKKKRNHHQ